MEQVCTEQDTAKIQECSKQKTAHVEANLKLQMQKHSSLMEQLLSLVSDTFLQLKQLVLDFRGILVLNMGVQCR